MGAHYNLHLKDSAPLRRLSDAGGRTYFEKDLLRVGTWQGANCPTWHVTLSTLENLVANFRRAKEAGAEFPVNFEHNNTAAAKAGEIEDVWIDGDRLMGRLWIGKTGDAEHLQLNQPKVSIEVDRPWTDGRGNVYDECLLAVALCNKPVYQGQGPFQRIALSLSGGHTVGKFVTRKIRRKLATGEVVEETADVETSGPSDDATEIAVTEVVAMLKKYFELDLPADVDTAKELRLVLETMMAKTESVSEAPAEILDATPVEQMPPAMLRLAVKTLRDRDAKHKAAIEATRKLSLERAKTAFEQDITEAIQRGVLTEADRPELLAAGEKADYSPVLVRHLKLAEGGTASNGSKTVKLRTGQAPALPAGVTKRPTDEECKEAAKKW